MVGERDVGEEAVRFVLEIAEYRQMLDAILDCLDVPVEHGAVRANAESMGGAMDLDPVFAGELLVGDGHAHAFAKDFRAAAGQSVEAGFTKRDQYILDRHLVDASDVGDLHRSEGLDVDVRISRLESAEHLAVVLEAALHIETADDVELFRQAICRRLRLGVHLIERVVISTLFLGETREGAEHAGFAQIADVGRIDVLVGGESHDVAMLATIGVVGEHAKPEQIRRRKKQLRIAMRQSSVGRDLFAHSPQVAIFDSPEVQRELGAHGLSSRRSV